MHLTYKIKGGSNEMDLEQKLKGLSDSEVTASREKYGRNEIEETPPETFFAAMMLFYLLL